MKRAIEEIDFELTQTQVYMHMLHTHDECECTVLVPHCAGVDL